MARFLDHALLAHPALFYLAIAAWAIFSIYWDKAAKTAAPAARTESRGSRAIHVILANAALLLAAAPIHGLGRLFPVSPVVMAAGLALEAAGLALAIWARRHLGRNWSGKISIKVEHELIRSGPYRLLRHPIYTGLLAMYTGLALVTGEWLAAIGWAMAIFAYARKVRMEEAVLAGAFAGQYAGYRRGTWALLPGIY